MPFPNSWFSWAISRFFFQRYCQKFTKKFTEEKILGIVYIYKLNSKSHLKNVCRKTYQKLSALSRISKLIILNLREKMVNYFINSQFSHCSLISSFTSKSFNIRIDRIHKKSLRQILNDEEISFNDMLSSLSKKTIQQFCINVLLIEVCKYLNGLYLELMNEVFICAKTIVTYAVIFPKDNPGNKVLLNPTV